MIDVFICDTGMLDLHKAQAVASAIRQFDDLRLLHGRRDTCKERIGSYLALKHFYEFIRKKELPRVLKDGDGAPFLDGGEEKISISHSGRLIAIALSDCESTGVDVQEEKELRFIERIEKDFLLLNDLYSRTNQEPFSNIYLGELTCFGEALKIKKCDNSLPFVGESGITVNKTLHSELSFYDKWAMTEAATKAVGRGLSCVRALVPHQDAFAANSFSISGSIGRYYLSAAIIKSSKK